MVEDRSLSPACEVYAVFFAAVVFFLAAGLRAGTPPACALVEADRARPGTAEHLAALSGITVLDLDLSAAQQETWAATRSRHAAQPTADRLDGAVVATTAPKRWDGEPVRILDLTP
ncbi:hypothetical protein [Streptomyces sp. NPDC020965]|uniref:hypothetical protein n=1 Tax=Streptomyces sp. NPDC020965 TaxID=3365105 RepID=UPI0037ABF1F5